MQNPWCHPGRSQTVCPPWWEAKLRGWWRQWEWACVCDHGRISAVWQPRSLSSRVKYFQGLHVAAANSKGWKGALKNTLPLLIAFKTNYNGIGWSPHDKKEGENTCPIINFLPSSPANIDRNTRPSSSSRALWHRPGGRWMGIVLSPEAQLTTNTTVRNTWSLFVAAKCNEISIGLQICLGLFWSGTYFYALRFRYQTKNLRDVKYSSSAEPQPSPDNVGPAATLIGS